MMEQAEAITQRDMPMAESYDSSLPKMPSPSSSMLQGDNMKLYCALAENVRVEGDGNPIQIPSASSSAPEFEIVGMSIAGNIAQHLPISPLPSSSFTSGTLSRSPSQNRPATPGNLAVANSNGVEAVEVDMVPARLMSPASSLLSLSRSVKAMPTTVSAVAPIRKYTDAKLPSPASTIDKDGSPKNIWAAAILRAQASKPAAPVIQRLSPGPVSTPDVVESGQTNALPPAISAPPRDTSRYIDNPNNNRDDFWEDLRRYPEDYYSMTPLPPPKYTAAERADKEARAEAKESQFLRKVVARRVADEENRKTHRGIYLKHEFKKLVYTCRDGAFAGKEVDKLPEWYKKELMSGGEGGLIDTDRALYLAMRKQGYHRSTLGYPSLTLGPHPDSKTKNEGENIGEKRKRGSGAGFADDSDNSGIPSMLPTDTLLCQQKRIKLSIRPSQVSDSLPVSRDSPIPAQPTQASGPVSPSQHGKKTLPGFIRNEEDLAIPLSSPHLADERELFSNSDDLTIGALLLGKADPPAEWKNGTSGVDKWMLDRLNSADDMFVGRAKGEFRKGVYKKFGY